MGGWVGWLVESQVQWGHHTSFIILCVCFLLLSRFLRSHATIAQSSSRYCELHQVSYAEMVSGLQIGYAQGSLGHLNYDSLQSGDLDRALERIQRVGLHRGEDLQLLCYTCSLVAQLRAALCKRDYFAAMTAVLSAVIGVEMGDPADPADPAEGHRMQDVTAVLQAVYAGTFRCHKLALDEWMLLVFESCDGYWRQLAADALKTGCLQGRS